MKRFLGRLYDILWQDNLKLLFLFLICLLPAPSWYLSAEIEAKAPPIRTVELDLNSFEYYPVNFKQAAKPELSAYSAVIIDLVSKTVMLAKNPDIQLAPASTTKIMTALVALDYYSLDQVLTMGEIETTGQQMGLEPGEQIQVKNLLYGLLVKSGNDAAYALADQYPGGREAFVAEMNRKLTDYHLYNTHFKNPAGFDQAGHYSTVRDLVLLSAEALKNPIFKEMISTAGLTISDVRAEHFHELENVNQLLGRIPGLKGIKTGWTAGAGECLISLIERDGRQVIIGILNSQDRFGETEILVNWVFDNFDWQPVEDYSNH